MDPLSLDAVLEARTRETLDGVLAGLEAEQLALPARIIYLVPGESVVWDDCCAGQLTARLATLIPHRTASTRPATMTPCSIDYWTATIEVTLLRCAAVIDNRGRAPLSERLSTDGLAGAKDLRVILETLTQLEFVDDVTAWVPEGPLGGCYGNTWRFTTKLDATPC